MNTDNIKTWTERLRDPQLKQARATLCMLHPDDTRSYCCLGLGSTLVPDMPAKVAFDGSSLLFGETQNENLAPREFIEWLGLKMPFSRSADITIDMPRLPLHDTPDRYLYHLSCASLNDCGFTFPQIADLIDHFGLKSAS